MVIPKITHVKIAMILVPHVKEVTKRAVKAVHPTYSLLPMSVHQNVPLDNGKIP